MRARSRDRSVFRTVFFASLMVVVSAGGSLAAELTEAIADLPFWESELLGSLPELSHSGLPHGEYYFLSSTPATAPLQTRDDRTKGDCAPLQVARLPGPEALSDIAEDWERLDALTRPRTPFSTALWNSLWWKHYRKHDLLVQDDFLVLTVRSPDSRLVAVAPLFRRSCPAIGPARGRMIQFFGADASITEMRGVICEPAHQTMVLDALETYFHREYRDWDLLRWDGVRGKREQRQHAATLVGAPGRQPNYFVPLPASWAELHSRVTGNFRRNMRKQRELFERDGHVYEFRVIDRLDDMAKALETLFDLHAKRAQFEEMDVKHPDRFANRVNREFISEYALEMARRGSARIYELDVGGSTIASQLTFAMDEDLWLYTSGFDPDWRRYGVMTMLTVEVMQWAINSKYKVVNLSCGHDRGKTRWRPSEVEYTYFLEGAPSVRGRLAMQAYETIESSRRVAARLRGYRKS